VSLETPRDGKRSGVFSESLTKCILLILLPHRGDHRSREPDDPRQCEIRLHGLGYTLADFGCTLHVPMSSPPDQEQP
jgi:hypothetical protein